MYITTRCIFSDLIFLISQIIFKNTHMGDLFVYHIIF
jgi:hypothetical protein